MPLTQLDPIAALIVIDLQKGIVSIPNTAHSTSEVVDRSAQLPRAFRQKNLPVVLVNVTPLPAGRTDIARPQMSLPLDWADLVLDLDVKPTDHLVTATAAHPRLAVEGDTVHVELAHAQVDTTIVGPQVPEEGEFPVPATSPCSFTVTLTRASGAVSLRASDFTILAAHLLGYVGRGIQNADETDRFNWYTSVLFTF